MIKKITIIVLKSVAFYILCYVMVALGLLLFLGLFFPEMITESLVKLTLGEVFIFALFPFLMHVKKIVNIKGK